MESMKSSQEKSRHCRRHEEAKEKVTSEKTERNKKHYSMKDEALFHEEHGEGMIADVAAERRTEEALAPKDRSLFPSKRHRFHAGKKPYFHEQDAGFSSQ